MSKKEASNQQKMSRNDRFAQMSHQEKIIEQKKKEIQAKLEAKKKISETKSQEDTSKPRFIVLNILHKNFDDKSSWHI